MVTTVGSKLVEPLDVRAGPQVTEQVHGAIALLNFAVESGFKSPDGHAIPSETIATIQAAANRLEIGDAPQLGAGEARKPTITLSEWVEFQLAYYNLATAMRPVTAETLRNTEGTSRSLFDATSGTGDGRTPSKLALISNLLLGYSPAQRFTRALWLVAIVFAAIVVCSEWALQVMALAPDAADDRANRPLRTIIELLVPWSYGGLGSCVYLLRSAHIYIYQRSFDLRRKPEYFNRVLLGTIAGGAIILLVNQIGGEEGTIIQLSSAALGFLAGYSTDFLFSTIERTIAAILPKVGIETVKRADTGPARIDVNDLADRYDKASGSAKDFYKLLMEHETGVRSPPVKNPRQRPAGRAAPQPPSDKK